MVILYLKIDGKEKLRLYPFKITFSLQLSWFAITDQKTAGHYQHAINRSTVKKEVHNPMYILLTAFHNTHRLETECIKRQLFLQQLLYVQRN